MLKFAKQVYENPLILLLLASSLVSALLGQYDDAACVVVAVGIVLTGEPYWCMLIQSPLFKNNGRKNPSKPSTNWFLTSVISSGESQCHS
jgi:hypothetical protein